MDDTESLDPDSSQEDSDDDDDVPKDESEPVKFFTNELSCKSRLQRLLIRNPKSRIWSAGFDLVAKVLVCVLYVVRVGLDDPSQYACDGEKCLTEQKDDSRSSVFTSTNINWHVIVWVHRPLALWIVQVVLCLLTSCKAVLYVSIATKGNVWDQLLTKTFILEMICSMPLLVTVFYPVMLKDFFVPLFLNCWMAKSALRRLMNDLHLTKQKFQTLSVTLNQQICFVAVTLVCIIFTTICGIQHIQRGSPERPLNLFEAVYFAVVTLSTVGYGDISPDIWLGQAFMLLMICVAFAFIPKQIEEIGSTWAQRKKTGGDYGERRAEKGKHVVVCATSFSADVVMNFLNEFYEHPKLEEHTVILMSSEELDSNMLFILKDPKWAHRVVYIKGSPLKDIDLKRCRINHAESVFFLCDRNCSDQEKSDQHTILRSWAVKDFAPSCTQCIQLFKATNKQHVRFAEHVICEDEFKFALLANNCLYPGLSTLVTLIVYTSRGKEGQCAKDSWQKVYGRHSGNEIYHIQLSNSVFFNKFQGKPFVQASAEVHEKLGVCLLAVLDSSDNELRLKLNPGPDYILKGNDYCFYMSQTKEEYSEVTMMLEEEPMSPVSVDHSDSCAFPLLAMDANEMDSRDDVILSEQETSMDSKKCDTPPSGALPGLLDDVEQDNIMAGPLPHSMAVGTKRIICHLHCDPRPLCCTAWGTDCEHCQFKNAGDSRWSKQLIIVAVDECSPAVYNFIIPLRSSYLSLASLYPVILLVENRPDSLFLETIAHFPLVYWMQGSLKSLDDLLKCGIHKAIHLVISNTGASAGSGTEERLEDAETVVMVQKITRLFPSLNILTDMKEDSNMRFMHFQANDTYTQQISRLEKRLKEKTSSNLPYMFRLPFAAGQVFSSAMLDRLLYQTFVKGYLICFVRLLLGIDAQKRSGHLSCVRVNRATIIRFPTYGDLYQSLCFTTGEVPIALYRTERRPGFGSEIQQSLLLGNNNSLSMQKGRPSIGGALFQRVEDYANVGGFLNSRLQRLQLGNDEPYVQKRLARTLSYVIVNPSPARRLKNGDLIYVLQPSSRKATPRTVSDGQSAVFTFPSQRKTTLSHVFDSFPSSKQPKRSAMKRPSVVSWNLDDCSQERLSQREALKGQGEDSTRSSQLSLSQSLSSQQESGKSHSEESRRSSRSSIVRFLPGPQESVKVQDEDSRPAQSPLQPSPFGLEEDVEEPGEESLQPSQSSLSRSPLGLRKGLAEPGEESKRHPQPSLLQSPPGLQEDLIELGDESKQPTQPSPPRSPLVPQEDLVEQGHGSRRPSQSSRSHSPLSLQEGRIELGERSIVTSQSSLSRSPLGVHEGLAAQSEESMQYPQTSPPPGLQEELVDQCEDSRRLSQSSSLRSLSGLQGLTEQGEESRRSSQKSSVQPTPFQEESSEAQAEEDWRPAPSLSPQPQHSQQPSLETQAEEDWRPAPSLSPQPQHSQQPSLETQAEEDWRPAPSLSPQPQHSQQPSLETQAEEDWQPVQFVFPPFPLHQKGPEDHVEKTKPPVQPVCPQSHPAQQESPKAQNEEEQEQSVSLPSSPEPSEITENVNGLEAEEEPGVQQEEHQKGQQEEHQKGQQEEHQKGQQEEHQKGQQEEHQKGQQEEHQKGQQEEHQKGQQEEHQKGQQEEHQKGQQEEHQKGQQEEHQKGQQEEHQKGQQERDEGSSELTQSATPSSRPPQLSPGKRSSPSRETSPSKSDNGLNQTGDDIAALTPPLSQPPGSRSALKIRWNLDATDKPHHEQFTQSNDLPDQMQGSSGPAEAAAPPTPM